VLVLSEGLIAAEGAGERSLLFLKQSQVIVVRDGVEGGVAGAARVPHVVGVQEVGGVGGWWVLSGQRGAVGDVGVEGLGFGDVGEWWGVSRRGWGGLECVAVVAGGLGVVGVGRCGAGVAVVG
jgi:hypothetical protein